MKKVEFSIIRPLDSHFISRCFVAYFKSKDLNFEKVGYFLYKKFLTDEKEEFTPPKEAETGMKAL